MKLFWKPYAVVYLAVVCIYAVQLVNKSSLFGTYYSITIIFNGWYAIPYFFNILNALLALIISVFVLGYSFEIKGLARLPAWIFYLRILTECTGHSFELKIIQSEFAGGKFFGFLGLSLLILPIIPSYLAQWRMTFLKKETLHRTVQG